MIRLGLGREERPAREPNARVGQGRSAVGGSTIPTAVAFFGASVVLLFGIK
jgi:hypothetical protein